MTVQEIFNNAALRTKVAAVLSAPNGDYANATDLTAALAAIGLEEAMLATASTENAVMTLINASIAVANAGSGTNTDAADLTARTTSSPNTSTGKTPPKKTWDKNIKQEDQIAAAGIIDQLTEHAKANQEAFTISGIFTRKPTIKSRLDGVTKMKVSVTKNMTELLQNCKPCKGSEDNLKLIKEIYAKAQNGDEMVDIYINDTAKPSVEAYELYDVSKSTKLPPKKALPKNRMALRHILTVEYAGKIKELETKEGTPSMGAYLSLVTDQTDPTKQHVSAKISGAKDYWDQVPDGIPTWEVVEPAEGATDAEKAACFETVNVRSALWAKVEVDNDPNKIRTLRLSGKVTVKAIRRAKDYSDFGEISKGVGNGGVKASEVDVAPALTNSIALIMDDKTLLEKNKDNADYTRLKDLFGKSKEAVKKSQDEQNQ